MVRSADTAPVRLGSAATPDVGELADLGDDLSASAAALPASANVPSSAWITTWARRAGHLGEPLLSRSRAFWDSTPGMRKSSLSSPPDTLETPKSATASDEPGQDHELAVTDGGPPEPVQEACHGAHLGDCGSRCQLLVCVICHMPSNRQGAR